MSDRQLSHEEALGLLDALADDELAPDEASRVRAHVADCSRCQALEAAMRGGLRALVSTKAHEAAPDLLPAVQRKLRLRSRGRYYGQRVHNSAWPLMLTSLALLGLLILSYVLLGQVVGTAPPPDPLLPHSTEAAPAGTR